MALRTMASSTTQIAAHQTDALLFFMLLQLTVIVLAARIGGEIAIRIGRSAAVGEIIVGILLGPSLFGLLAPDTFKYVFHSAAPEPMQMPMLSQIGLVLLMFQIGLEFDFSHLGERRNRKAMLWVAFASLIAPFALGYIIGQISAPVLSPGAHPQAWALFIATAFSITALPILGRIMMEFDMTRLPIGVIAISAATINDVIGWLLLAMVTTLTGGLMYSMVSTSFVGGHHLRYQRLRLQGATAGRLPSIDAGWCYGAVALRTACSHSAMRSSALFRGMVGRKVRSTRHCALSSSVPAYSPVPSPAR